MNNPRSQAKYAIAQGDYKGEYLDEVDQKPPPQYSELEEASIDQDVSWVPAPPTDGSTQKLKLQRPILIPAVLPGIQSSFTRAWAPELSNHGIDKSDFLQFIDHLNVCKAASPPLQVLSLAGTILGFTPIPFAFAISTATSAAAAGGEFAVARVRLGRYLTRINKEYFVPRGLLARIVKQKDIPQITGQSAGAPLLAPVPDGVLSDPESVPSLRDRRLQALGGHIERLHLEDLPASSEERNIIDKMSAKMVARKADRNAKKSKKNAIKAREDLEDEKAKAAKEMRKINEKTEKELRKHPEQSANIEYKKEAEVHKIESELREKELDAHEDAGVGGEKEEQQATKFLWIVICNWVPPAEPASS
ncbi:MAG: hypothetical protein M1818_004790 [Claussenomyces sp. TS43310]|nr:MAG: hypothetical protein M1818_004790 [Claussenomyces sp. TS43310]